MLSSVARLFSTEMTKTWRTKFPYLGIAASALMALVAQKQIEAFSRASRPTFAEYLSTSINLSSTWIIPIFSTIFASMIVAAETSRGTLRTILVRPVSRADFLTAKLLMAIFYLLVLFAANLAVALIIGKNLPWQAIGEDRPDLLPGGGAQIALFAIAVGLSLLPQIATVVYGVFVSVMSVNVATAIGFALGLLFTLQIAKEKVRFGDFELDQWIFSSYYDTAVGIATGKAQGVYEAWNDTKVYFLVGTSVLTALVLAGIAYARFTRRDLNI